MTDKLLCPFCQQELRPLAIGWCCDCGLCADKELWQRLIRTRKALDVAVDALKQIDWCATDYAKAQDALDEITALEQKDVK